MRRLVLESGDGEYAETVVCQGMHADLKEGKEALRQGKKITAARLRIAHDKTEWEFTFKADRFHFQSMKLPTLPESDGEEVDREGQLLERIYLIEKAAGMMDLLFRSFLNIRLLGGLGKGTDPHAEMDRPDRIDGLTESIPFLLAYPAASRGQCARYGFRISMNST